jgi:hypothetical protein
VVTHWSDVSALDDDFSEMHFESSSSEEEFTNDVVNLQIWNDIALE